MSERFVLRHLGREVVVELAERTLLVGSASVDLDAIREVRVARIGNLEICAIRLEGGGERTFATDEAASRSAFAGAVRALWTALHAAPGRRVSFVSGSWMLAGLIGTITLVCGLLGALLFFGVLDVPAFAVRGGVLALVCAVLGPVGIVRSRPKKLETSEALSAVLPRG